MRRAIALRYGLEPWAVDDWPVAEIQAELRLAGIEATAAERRAQRHRLR